MTIKVRIPTYTPNEVREEIATIISNAHKGTGSGQIRAIYDYRAFPNLASVEVTITSFGSNPVSGPILGDPFYDHIIDIHVRHENTQASLREAEQGLNALISSIWVTLVNTKATTYREAYPYQPVQAPGAPSEVATIRRGFLFVRATPY